MTDWPNVNFTEREVTGGSRGGPLPAWMRPAMFALLINVAQPIRERWGRLLVTSGYRPGDPGQHGKAEALDLRPLDADRQDVWEWLLTAKLPIDQGIIYEDTRHLHISHVTGRTNRNAFLVHLEPGSARHEYETWSHYTGRLRKRP